MTGPFKTRETKAQPEGQPVYLANDLTKYHPHLIAGSKGVVVGRSVPGFREVRFECCGVVVSIALGSIRSTKPGPPPAPAEDENDDDGEPSVPNWSSI